MVFDDASFIMYHLFEFFVTNNYQVIVSKQLYDYIDITLWPQQLHVLQIDIKLFKLKHPNIILYNFVYTETNCSGNVINLSETETNCTAQKTKFSIKDFFSNGDQIRRNRRIWSHLLKKYLIKNLLFLCSVDYSSRTFNPVMHNVLKWPNIL